MPLPLRALPLALALASACNHGPSWDDAFDTSATGALSGVWGSSPDNVYIAGGSDAGAEIYHFDGHSWTPETIPAGAGMLSWVYGFGADDVYAVGVSGTALHWDGAAWTLLDTPTTEDLWGVFGLGPNDVWMVGGTINQGAPEMLHWDGTAFTSYELPAEQNNRGATSLFKVWGAGDTLFAVGQRGLILQWSGSEWLAVSAGAQADQDWVSLWGSAPDHIVAVGGRANARIGTWDGATWTTEAPSGVGGLNAVTLLTPETALVGGVNGYAATLDVASGALTPEPPISAIDLHAMWFDGDRTAFAVGGRFTEPFGGVALARTAH